MKTHSYATQTQLEETYLAEQHADIPQSDEKQLREMLDDGDAALNGEITAAVSTRCG